MSDKRFEVAYEWTKQCDKARLAGQTGEACFYLSRAIKSLIGALAPEPEAAVENANYREMANQIESLTAQLAAVQAERDRYKSCLEALRFGSQQVIDSHLHNGAPHKLPGSGLGYYTANVVINDHEKAIEVISAALEQA